MRGTYANTKHAAADEAIMLMPVDLIQPGDIVVHHRYHRVAILAPPEPGPRSWILEALTDRGDTCLFRVEPGDLLEVRHA